MGNWLKCFAALALIGVAAWADAAVDEKLLGLTEQSLREQLPEVVRLEKPVWGPHRVRGTYTLRNAVLNRQTFHAIFYFKDGRVDRIEQRQSNPVAQCDVQYASLNASLGAIYGSERGSDERPEAVQGVAEQQSNAWSSNTFNVHLYKMQDENRCELMVVFMPHTEIDASTL